MPQVRSARRGRRPRTAIAPLSDSRRGPKSRRRSTRIPVVLARALVVGRFSDPEANGAFAAFARLGVLYLNTQMPPWLRLLFGSGLITPQAKNSPVPGGRKSTRDPPRPKPSTQRFGERRLRPTRSPSANPKSRLEAPAAPRAAACRGGGQRWQRVHRHRGKPQARGSLGQEASEGPCPPGPKERPERLQHWPVRSTRSTCAPPRPRPESSTSTRTALEAARATPSRASPSRS